MFSMTAVRSLAPLSLRRAWLELRGNDKELTRDKNQAERDRAREKSNYAAARARYMYACGVAVGGYVRREFLWRIRGRV